MRGVATIVAFVALLLFGLAHPAPLFWERPILEGEGDGGLREWVPTVHPDEGTLARSRTLAFGMPVAASLAVVGDAHGYQLMRLWAALAMTGAFGVLLYAYGAVSAGLFLLLPPVWYFAGLGYGVAGTVLAVTAATVATDAALLLVLMAAGLANAQAPLVVPGFVAPGVVGDQRVIVDTPRVVDLSRRSVVTVGDREGQPDADADHRRQYPRSGGARATGGG